MKVETIVVGFMQTNCYVVWSNTSREAVIIDPGADYEKIEGVIKKLKLKPQCVVLTHGHYDHVGAVEALKLPVYMYQLDAQQLSDPEKNLSAFFGVAKGIDADIHYLKENDTIDIDDIHLKVIHTPGHTPGQVAFFRTSDRVLLTGDALLTADLNSFRGFLLWALRLNRQRVAGPPWYSTWDKKAAKESVAALACLEPRVLASGHGVPMTGDGTAGALRSFADHFCGPNDVENAENRSR